MNNFPKNINIPKNYKYQFIDGIHKIITSDFEEKLNIYLNKFTEIQKHENHYTLPFTKFKEFPNIICKELSSEIFTRKQDIEIIKKHFSSSLKQNNSVLEIGGWNGWLTKMFAEYNLDIISADIFEDERNGLKSKKHHINSNWTSIQTDILETDIYTKTFDIIVFNHCLQFYPNTDKLIEKYKQLLSKNGILLIIESTFYKNTTIKKIQTTKMLEYYKEKYQFEIQFYSSKGHFNYDDFQTLKNNKFKFITYHFSLLGKIKKILKKEKSGILYYVNS